MFDNGSLLRRRKRFKTINGIKRKIDSESLAPDDLQQANNANNISNEFDFDDDEDDEENDDDDEDNQYTEEPTEENDEAQKTLNSPSKFNLEIFLRKQAELQQSQQYIQFIQNPSSLYPLMMQHQQQQQKLCSETSPSSSTSSLVVSLQSNNVNRKTVNNNISPLSMSSSSSLLSTPSSSLKSLQFSSSSPNDDVEPQAKKQKVSSSFSIDSLIGNVVSSSSTTTTTIASNSSNIGSSIERKEKTSLNKLNSQSVTIKHNRPSKLSKPDSKTVLYQSLYQEETNNENTKNKKKIQQHQLFTESKPSHLISNCSASSNSRGTSISSNNSSGSRCVSPTNIIGTVQNHNLSVDVENSSSQESSLHKTYVQSHANLLNNYLNSNNYAQSTNSKLRYLPGSAPVPININSNSMLTDCMKNESNGLFETMSMSFSQQQQQQLKGLNQSQNFYKLLNDSMIMRAAVAAAAQSAQINYLLYNNQNNSGLNSLSQSNNLMTIQPTIQSSQSEPNGSNLLPLFMPMRT